MTSRNSCHTAISYKRGTGITFTFQQLGKLVIVLRKYSRDIIYVVHIVLRVVTGEREASYCALFFQLCNIIERQWMCFDNFNVIMMSGDQPYMTFKTSIAILLWESSIYYIEWTCVCYRYYFSMAERIPPIEMIWKNAHYLLIILASTHSRRVRISVSPTQLSS